MSRRRRLRRGMYLLPTLFTIGNLFCGFSSVLQSLRGGLYLAALLIIVAGILDGLDGRIARLTGSTSDFGRQFDSMADIVSFGVAPAVLAYQVALEPLGRAGWMVASLYVVCASMRLARFNLSAVAPDKRYFAGLPSPAAAGAVAAPVFVFPEPFEPRWLGVLGAIVVAAIALLMISRLRYRSFKDLDLRHRRSYGQVFPLAALLVGLFVFHEVLPVLALGYLLSAPAVLIWNGLRRGTRADEVVDERPGG